MQHFVDELIEHYREMLIARATGEPEKILEVSAEEVKRLREMAGNFSEEQLMYAIDVLAEAQMKLGNPGSQQIVLEVALVQLVRSRDRVSIDDLIRKIDEVRSQGGGLSRQDVALGLGEKAGPQPDLFSSVSGVGGVKETALEPVTEKDAKDFGHIWDKVMHALAQYRPSLKENLAFGKIVSFENGVLRLGFDRGHSFHKNRVADEANRKMVEGLVSEKIGDKVRIEVEETADEQPPSVAPAGRAEDIPAVKKALDVFGGKVVDRRR